MPFDSIAKWDQAMFPPRSLARLIGLLSSITYLATLWIELHTKWPWVLFLWYAYSLLIIAFGIAYTVRMWINFFREQVRVDEELGLRKRDRERKKQSMKEQRRLSDPTSDEKAAIAKMDAMLEEGPKSE